MTPDGTHAVVANTESHTVSIIDLSTDTVVATLPVSSRPAEILISPDSQTAYVTTVAGTDRLHFIQLAGVASSILGSLVTGQMGSAFGYTYSETSEIALSADGSVLAVAVSFDDELLLIDTATRTEMARVALPASSFPMKADFSPDGSTVYVINAVDVDGRASQVGGGVGGQEAGQVGEFPGIAYPPDRDSFTGLLDELLE